MSLFIFVDESRTNNRSSSSNEEISSHQADTPKEKAPRPKNAFMLYRQEKQKGLPLSKTKLLSKDFSKIAAEMWRRESNEVRMYYHRLAEEEKLRHLAKHPGYKYCPKRQSLAHVDKNEYQVLADTTPIVGEMDDQIAFVHRNVSFDEVSPSSPPSSMIQDLQIFPEGTNLDALSLVDYEFYLLLSIMS